MKRRVLRLLSLCMILVTFLSVSKIMELPAKAEENENSNSIISSSSPKVGDVLELDESKIYKIYDAYDENGKELDAISDNSRVIFNNGGAKVGWLKYGNKFETTASAKYLWRATTFDENEKTFVLTNQDAQNSHSIVAGQIGNVLNGSGASNFAVVKKGNLSKGSPLKFIVMAVENGKTYVKIEQVPYTDEQYGEISNRRYMSTENFTITKNTDVTSNSVRSYVTWIDNVSNTDRRNGWWVIEEVTTMPGSVEGSKLLFSTFSQKYHYRIPAITTTNKGDVILFADYRYDSNSDIGTNWTGWNGVDNSGYANIGHRIDQVMRYSQDNGENWSEEENLTEEYSYKGQANVKLANGYGDPALVADRESDKVLMLAVGGSYGFHQDYPGIISMLSNDGGRTFDTPRALAGRTTGTDAMSTIPTDNGLYDLDNGGSDIYSMFITSGRMFQSRYIKVGSSYRIYCAPLAKVRGTNDYKNFVFYSDNFGESWNALPGIAINGADEAKVEELPNGDVVVTSRTAGGRKINIFSYNKEDNTYSSGNWGTQSQFTIPESRSYVNGDLYILYAKNNETNEYGYLVCQTFTQGTGRSDARVYYKWLDENSNTPQGFAQGFTSENSFVLAKNASAYSVMTLLSNGKLGFAWEEGEMWYNISYATLSLETITNNKYSLAFSSGIGSVDKPYIITSEEELNAYKNVYSNERVYFKTEGEAKVLEDKAALIENLEEAFNKKVEELNNLPEHEFQIAKIQLEDIKNRALQKISTENYDLESIISYSDAALKEILEFKPYLVEENVEKDTKDEDNTMDIALETKSSEKINVQEKSSISEKTNLDIKSNLSPKTGDESSQLLYIGLMFISAMILIVVNKKSYIVNHFR
ncbi:sialidase family protein [uncultured Clostridium sp.]|uniref:sialidase family protein n=1 Tax=uncultured Clostridium sp. TaxID=59620 RepID=UPI0025CE6C0A|nr:sialidase family protein [uncultured Clostridium sp.]